MSRKKPKELEILKAASIKFCTNGFSKTNIQEIADHAQIGKGTIYEYFESKEDLFVSTINYNHEIYLTELKKTLDSANKFIEKLNNYFYFNKLFIEKNIKNIELLFTNEFSALSIDSKNRIKNDMLHMRIKLIKIIEDILLLGQNNKTLKKINTNFVADIFIEMVFRTCVRFVQMNITEIDKETEKEDLFNIVFYGIYTK